MTLLAPIVDERQYLDAIARRNRAQLDLQDARDWLDATPLDAGDIRARRSDHNACQDEYEHACRDLIWARGWFQRSRDA